MRLSLLEPSSLVPSLLVPLAASLAAVLAPVTPAHAYGWMLSTGQYADEVPGGASSGEDRETPPPEGEMTRQGGPAGMAPDSIPTEDEPGSQTEPGVMPETGSTPSGEPAPPGYPYPPSCTAPTPPGCTGPKPNRICIEIPGPAPTPTGACRPGDRPGGTPTYPGTPPGRPPGAIIPPGQVPPGYLPPGYPVPPGCPSPCSPTGTIVPPTGIPPEGWCCAPDGRVMLTPAWTCMQGDGAFFSDRDRALRYCAQPPVGWCCVQGSVFQAPVDECLKEEEGILYGSREQAELYCRPPTGIIEPEPVPTGEGWCCADGETYPAAPADCRKVGGKLFSAEEEARAACRPPAGVDEPAPAPTGGTWCCADGETFSAAPADCDEAGGEVYATREEAREACRRPASELQPKPPPPARATGGIEPKPGEATVWCCAKGDTFTASRPACLNAGGRPFATERMAAAACERASGRPGGGGQQTGDLQAWCCARGKVLFGSIKGCREAGGLVFNEPADAERACGRRPSGSIEQRPPPVGQAPPPGGGGPGVQPLPGLVPGLSPPGVGFTLAPAAPTVAVPLKQPATPAPPPPAEAQPAETGSGGAVIQWTPATPPGSPPPMVDPSQLQPALPTVQ